MLNPSLITKRLIRNATIKMLLIFLLCAVLSIMLCCGKRKPPQPPIERVQQRTQVSGFQRGNQIRLSWKMPPYNASNGSVLNISRADIYRMAEPANASQTLTEDEFASRSTLIASVPISDADFTGKTLSYMDALDFAGRNTRLRYAIRFVNSSGSKAAFSNFLLIEPAAKIAAAPSLLPVKVAQENVLLEWKPPTANIDGSTPVNILGYNIYRAADGEQTAGLLNKTPVAEGEFRDQRFEFAKNYKYFVRTVSLGNNAEPVESEESNVVEITPKDTFAPNPPEGITLAATPTTISIFFASNVERDIAGYKIFRSTDKVDWKLLTDKLLETNTFQDKQVESGKIYFYYLIAVDRFGNESAKSEIVSENVP